ncbi:hypothetical protein [Dyella japonica]|uniref:Autotransporter domain-containing protein n=1 Tax=Dyella japonica A8 TaxID=1217721 RepID=A0A075K3Y9_9GAMM|nr:hypothetical protein [Dyella japonica]AIF48785.1 hypothetical protein HY57_16810 [Dyella japonica A8]
MKPVARILTLMACLYLALPAEAQDHPRFDIIKGQLQQRANAALALMGYLQTPDVTSGALSIKDASTDNPAFNNSSLGGGFVLSDSVPIYMEGTIGYSRYDPRFVASNGQEQRDLPTRWNNLVVTAGIGWNVQVTRDFAIIPIVNGSYGTVKSDVQLGSLYIERNTNLDLQFLANGHLDAAGAGGSLLLSYDHVAENYEAEVQLRYTDIYTHSVNSSSRIVQGSSRNENLSLWSRYRAPTGMHALDRPVRYVLEYAHTEYFGSEATVIAVNHLNSLGAGLELDTSKYHPLWIYRARAVLRYVFAPGVQGVSLGLAVTFD